MYIEMGKTWVSTFKFLEASSTLDADADGAEISVTDGTADTPATASSLEVSIPIALVQQSWGCTLANASGLTGRNCQTWTLRGMETAAWHNWHHLLPQLQTDWVYWVVAAFYHSLPLQNWVSSEICHRLLLQVYTGQEFGP